MKLPSDFVDAVKEAAMDSKSRRFWSTLAKCMASAWVLALLMIIMEWFPSADVTQFSWVKPFGFPDIFPIIGIASFLGGLLGIVMGVLAAFDEVECGEVLGKLRTRTIKR